MSSFLLPNFVWYALIAYWQEDIAWILPFDQWEPETLIFVFIIQIFFVIPWMLVSMLTDRKLDMIGICLFLFLLAGCSTPKYPSIYSEKSYNKNFPTEYGEILNIDKRAVSRFRSIDSIVLTIQIDKSHVEAFNSPRVITVVQPKQDHLDFFISQRVYLIYGKEGTTVLPL